jgi:NAD(P)-dependent dehydrogenase (short-subunit alcohol dehydrogenase family)
MNNKVALITGGSSSIGKATAIAFAKAGAKVAIASRQKSRAEKALKEIEREGTEAIWIETDVSDAAQVKAMVSQIVSHFGRLDVAFNNGGNGRRGGLTADLSEESWNKTIQGYLTSVWLCMKYKIPAMLEQSKGAIVNNASVDGVRGYPFPFGSAYSAAKHGVIGLTKSAAKEYIQKGIRINAICPGWIDTPPVANLMKPKMAKAILEQEPIGRLGTLEEVADLVVWLCSDKASFMVGAEVAVDGGYLA